ncbi:hypothetical protein AGOR_G00204280 [Albula goreensis]|uniref:Aldehyde dehydrogenase domain-containing protein n=1 Tax=Albula goreensis TaxID=1534307 RepID=A0A8T3CS36_9TELE|nr:hypothetical protein AGOR_G00204280 [Albula goreensis]
MGILSLVRNYGLLRKIQPGLPVMLHRLYSLDVSADLLRTQAFIGGKWVSAPSSFPVLDPATGEEIASVSDCGPEHAQDAINAAYSAFYLWKEQTAKERSILLRKWFDLVTQHKEDLAKLIICGVCECPLNPFYYGPRGSHFHLTRSIVKSSDRFIGKD